MKSVKTSAIMSAMSVVFVSALAGEACLGQTLPNVAILGATTAADQADVQSKLIGTGRFSNVTIVPVVTPNPAPTLATLQQYDAVLLWTNQSLVSGEAMGNVLADYVDAGGGVVNCMFSVGTTTNNRYLTGRWDSTYQIIPQNGGATTGAAGVGIGNRVIPGHPVLANVNTFLGGTSNTRPTSTLLTPHGVLVAQWVDGKTLVAVSNTRPGRVDLGFYPPSMPTNSTGWNPATDGATLMANALVFVSSPAAPPCGSADFNADGDTGTDADIEAFFACLGGNCCATCPTNADFNGDGDVGTDADIEAFFRVLAGGNC